ncbi:MAK10-like protein [Tanacetum coccineum]|uniref:MAK10-like protein n=1 Tax=Tanacetum coccineum TaxID=301880 RepID=A0ABQ5GIV4_9ASTR
MGDENPIRTLGDYSKPSHEGYRNTIELPAGNNVVPLRSDTIRLVQNGCSFHGLRSEDPNQHLKDFLKLVDSLDLDGENRERTRLRRTVKLRNDILMFQQHHEESLLKPWTHFKDLLQKVPHHGIDLWLQVQIFYDHVNPVIRGSTEQSAGDFAKPVKAIVLPQDVPSTSNRRLIKLENQVQRLMEAYLAPTLPIQVNKITTSCEICSGLHDSQYCMEDPEQAFVEYASSRTDEAGGLVSNFMASQDARLSRFKTDFKQQQSEMTNKIDIVLKAITDRITGTLPSDTVKNPKLGTHPAHFKEATISQTSLRQPEIETKPPQPEEAEPTLEDEFQDLHLNLPDPETPLLVGRGFLATANAVIDYRMAKIAVGEGITRDAELNPFKDTLVFRRMVEFLGAIPINLKCNMWESKDLIKKLISWDKPPKNRDGAWHAKIRLIDPDGEEFSKTLQSIPTTRKLPERESRKAHLLEDKQILNVEAFGGNTRDLGIFGEETDKTTDLHQHGSRISLQWLETASQIQRDAVTMIIKKFLQNILDLYFKHFKLSEDVVNRILQVVLDLQHFKSSLCIFAATSSSAILCVLTPVRGESLKILNGFDVSLPVSHSLWSSQSFGHQKAINGFDMPLPVAVCSGLVNPLAPRKGPKKQYIPNWYQSLAQCMEKRVEKIEGSIRSLAEGQQAIINQINDLFSQLKVCIDEVLKRGHKETPDATWEEFKTIIYITYGPHQFLDYFGELTKLRQQGTVQSYQFQFNKLLAKVGYLPQDRQVSCFVSGFKDSVRTEVQANCPTNLSTAISVARLYEAKTQSQRKSATGKSLFQTLKQPTSSIVSPIKRLNFEELNERKKLGLCFRCNEQYAPRHKCKKLFVIQLVMESSDDDEEMEIENQEPKLALISIHALSMKFKLNGKEQVLQGFTTPSNKMVADPQRIENVVVDVLSRMNEETTGGSLRGITLQVPGWLSVIKEEQSASSNVQRMIRLIHSDEAVGPWNFQDEILYFKGRIYLDKDSSSLQLIIEQFHNSTHEGFHKTLHRIRANFYSKGLRTMVQNFVRACDVCQ